MLAALFSWGSGCGSGEGADGLAGRDEPCESSADCASDWCDLGRTCVAPCTGDGDCMAGERCHADIGGRRRCGPPCTFDSVSDAVCVDGTQMRCDEAPADQHCQRCGCSQGTYCTAQAETPGVAPSDVCQPKRALDEACFRNEYCLSGNCSAHGFGAGEAGYPAGTCLPEAGTPCEPMPDGACDCQRWPDAYQCVQNCVDDDDCEGRAVCVPYANNDWGVCYAGCDPDPCYEQGFACRAVAGRDDLFACMPPR